MELCTYLDKQNVLAFIVTCIPMRTFFQISGWISFHQNVCLNGWILIHFRHKLHYIFPRCIKSTRPWIVKLHACSVSQTGQYQRQYHDDNNYLSSWVSCTSSSLITKTHFESSVDLIHALSGKKPQRFKTTGSQFSPPCRQSFILVQW